MKKRFSAVLTVSAMLLLLVACGGKKSYHPGTYEGKGQGYSPDTPIRLSVSIDEDGAIHEIRILEQDETDLIGGKALDELVKNAVKKNSADIDSVTHATRTSEGFRQALSAALEQAKKGSGDSTSK